MNKITEWFSLLGDFEIHKPNLFDNFCVVHRSFVNSNILKIILFADTFYPRVKIGSYLLKKKSENL